MKKTYEQSLISSINTTNGLKNGIVTFEIPKTTSTIIDGLSSTNFYIVLENDLNENDVVLYEGLLNNKTYKEFVQKSLTITFIDTKIIELNKLLSNIQTSNLNTDITALKDQLTTITNTLEVMKDEIDDNAINNTTLSTTTLSTRTLNTTNNSQSTVLSLVGSNTSNTDYTTLNDGVGKSTGGVVGLYHKKYIYMPILNSNFAGFSFNFPIGFIPDKINEKYKKAILKLPQPHLTVIDFLNSTIQSINFPGLSISPSQQEFAGTYAGKDTKWKNSIVIPDMFEKNLSITFKYVNGFVNYWLMFEIFLHYLDFQNTEPFLENLKLYTMDSTGDILMEFDMIQTLFTSISSLDLSYSSNNPTFSTFNCTFVYNNINMNIKESY